MAKAAARSGVFFIDSTLPGRKAGTLPHSRGPGHIKWRVMVDRREFLGASVGLGLGSFMEAPTGSESFPGFERKDIRTEETVIHTVTGGSGPPVLLLHGFPQ